MIDFKCSFIMATPKNHSADEIRAVGGRDVLVRYCRRSSDRTAFQMLGMKIATAEDRDRLACHHKDKQCQASRLINNAQSLCVAPFPVANLRQILAVSIVLDRATGGRGQQTGMTTATAFTKGSRQHDQLTEVLEIGN
jgi:hypothetical protein